MKTKKRISTILIILLTLISYLYTYNTNTSVEIQSISATLEPAAASQSIVPAPDFSVSAEGAVLIDSKTGKILYGKNENQKLYPASTTKIITAIIAIENCKPTDKITASYDAVMSLPSGYANAAIQPGETLTFQELLDMFLIHSANEIGTIFAEHIAGSVENFAILMNKKATEIGCKNTHFTNPSGIHDEQHYSTAYDMALIAKYCMKNTTFRNTVAKTSCTIEATEKYEKRYFKNTNDLINPSSDYYYEYAIGTKTGYTSQAKRCLIATSLKDNLELITVILGSQSSKPDTRYLDTINLFKYGFSNYTTKQIATKNTIVEKITIENATKETQDLSLLIKDNLISLTPSNLKLTDLDYSVKLNDTILAPISEGEVLGKITYTIEGIEYSSDLIANHSVEKFDLKTMLIQITLALFVLFILSKLVLPKKKSKKRKYKKGTSKNKKSKSKKRTNYKKSNDSIYKF